MADSFEEIALHQSIIRRQWLPLDVAVQELITFENLFGTGHFLLACHAALPSLLTPELLHSIRVNFLDQQKPSTPWIAEMDFLLSPLCRPVEKDIFEVEPMAREALLFKLEERYGWQQLQHVADFLLQYLYKNRTGKHDPGVAQLHEWIALSYLQPDKVVQDLLHLLNESVNAQSTDYQTLPKKLRVARTMELLAEPLRYTMLQEEYTSLVHSARVLAYTLYNSKETFPATIRATGAASGRTGTLFPPALQQWLSTITVPQRASTVDAASPAHKANVGADISPTASSDQPTTPFSGNTVTTTMASEREDDRIVTMLKQAGWVVQSRSEVTDSIHDDTAQGIAIRDTHPDGDFIMYLLLVDGVEVGAIALASADAVISVVGSYEEPWQIRLPLPFVYEVTGFEIQFTNTLEPEARSRHVFHFHRPETLSTWLKLAPASTPNELNNLLRSCLRRMRSSDYSPRGWLNDLSAQVNAKIEQSLAANHTHVFVQMPNGSGKTRILVNLAFQLLFHARAQRVLYLVRNSVERATYRKFEQFRELDQDDQFFRYFNVQILEDRTVDASTRICIATVEQFYSAFSGVQIAYNTYGTLPSDQEQTTQRLTDESINIQYNPSIPIEFFDVILIDDCAPDTYQRWRPLLEYFDAFIIGATSNTDGQELNFFHNNLVYSYKEQDTLALPIQKEEATQEPRPEEDDHGTLVHHLFSTWLAEQQRTRATPFTEEQIPWLERISDRIATAGKFEEQDFNLSPFPSGDGLNTARLLFGAELPALLQALNAALHPLPEENLSQDDLEALLEASTPPITIKRGDVVEGVIVRIDPHEILVDIGAKSEGVLYTRELPASGYSSFKELHLHDKIIVSVLQPETPESRALLSLKRGNNELQWRIAEEQYKNGKLFKARVIDFNKGGLIVDISGIRGFVPISQILNLKREEVDAGAESQETTAKLQDMLNQELRLKIIELDQQRNRLVLSERMAAQEWRQRRHEELLDELKPGEVRKGTVSNLADFGAFVDLGGADGLVHISQIAWSRIDHPADFLHVGQEVVVHVLSIDKKKKNIALSIKRAQVDPWTTVEERYTPGQIVTGIVTSIAPYGAFARIEDGVDGLIHNSEVPPGTDVQSVLREGAQLQLRILRVKAERRRLGLSLRLTEEVDEMTAETTTTTPNDEDREEEVNISEEANISDTSDTYTSNKTLTLASSSTQTEANPSQKKKKKKKKDYQNETPLDDEGNPITAMAQALDQAFRATARLHPPEDDNSDQRNTT